MNHKIVVTAPPLFNARWVRLVPCVCVGRPGSKYIVIILRVCRGTLARPTRAVTTFLCFAIVLSGDMGVGCGAVEGTVAVACGFAWARTRAHACECGRGCVLCVRARTRTDVRRGCLENEDVGYRALSHLMRSSGTEVSLAFSFVHSSQAASNAFNRTSMSSFEVLLISLGVLLLDTWLDMAA